LDITAETLVADIAAHHPRSIEVFERHGIDFCCGGRRPLGEACRDHGAAVEAVAAEIAAAAAREVPEDRVFTDAPLGALLDHIVSRYHAALREDLPRLGRMADKVAEVHGARHPELHEHVHLENNVLFPRVVSLQARLEGRGAPVEGAR
jgi:regulator of cell morphogenesis and NO signaling